MTADDPEVFQQLSPYAKARLMIASAIIFRKSGWKEWSYGHEKLIGVVLWHYEMKKEGRFKYSRLLKRCAYGRTQNYKLLKSIVEKEILVKQGNGYYTLSEKYQGLLDEIFEAIKILDSLGKTKQEE
jgi:hypothetical protein